MTPLLYYLHLLPGLRAEVVTWRPYVNRRSLAVTPSPTADSTRRHPTTILPTGNRHRLSADGTISFLGSLSTADGGSQWTILLPPSPPPSPPLGRPRLLHGLPRPRSTRVFDQPTSDKDSPAAADLPQEEGPQHGRRRQLHEEPAPPIAQAPGREEVVSSPGSSVPFLVPNLPPNQ